MQIGATRVYSSHTLARTYIRLSYSQATWVEVPGLYPYDAAAFDHICDTREYFHHDLRLASGVIRVTSEFSSFHDTMLSL